MLKPIPVEHGARNESKKSFTQKTAQKRIHQIQKSRQDNSQSSSANYIASPSPHPPFLKIVGLRLVEFFKRSTVFTVEQINELIEGLQRAVLRLQKRKQQLLTEQRFKLNEETNNDTGKKAKFHRKKLQ